MPHPRVINLKIVPDASRTQIIDLCPNRLIRKEYRIYRAFSTLFKWKVKIQWGGSSDSGLWKLNFKKQNKKTSGDLKQLIRRDMLRGRFNQTVWWKWQALQIPEECWWYGNRHEWAPPGQVPISKLPPGLSSIYFTLIPSHLRVTSKLSTWRNHTPNLHLRLLVICCHVPFLVLII